MDNQKTPLAFRLTLFLAALALLVSVALSIRTQQVVAQLEGVTNYNGVHLSQSTFGTATPQFEINNDGNNQSFRILDAGGTPEVYVDADGGMTVNDFTGTSGGNLDLNGNSLVIDADADTNLVASTDDLISVTLGAATGQVQIVTGNVKVGNGTEDTTLDGEDAYIEGTLEVDGATNFDGAMDVAGGLTVSGGGATVSSGGLTVSAGLTTLSGGLNCTPQAAVVAAGWTITPTSCIISLTSTGEVTSSTTTGIITTSATSGDVIILANNNASDVINVDGTGGTIECKADVALGASDTLALWYNGTDSVWNCLFNYDNS